MNRILSTKRLYNLGDFKNIEFYDQVNDIPEEAAVDQEVIANLRYIMLLDIEAAYRAYKNYGSVVAGFKTQEELDNYISAERQTTYANLLAKLYKKEQENN